MISTIHSRLIFFFKRYRALSFALLAMLSTSTFLFQSLFSCLLLIFLLFGFLYESVKAHQPSFFFKYLSVVFLSSSYALTTLFYLPSQTQPLQGSATFKLNEIRLRSNFGRSSYVYLGHCLTFQDTLSKKTYYNLPLMIKMKKPSHLDMNHHFAIHNLTLKPSPNRRYFVKLQDTSCLSSTSKGYSLAPLRFQLKQKASLHLKRHISDYRTFKLLSALTTGQLDHKTLQFEFSRLGLQHILAISGLHFALLASLLRVLLQFFLSKKTLNYTLIALLSLYVLYMGDSPSVSRAFIAVMIHLIGEIFGLKPKGLNTLGIAIILSLIADPFILAHIGFQLSFLASFGILLTFQSFDHLLTNVWKLRSFKEVTTMHSLDKAFYLLGCFLRKSIALNLSVTVMTLPLILKLSGQFPFLGFFYNLLIPLLFSLVMVLLLLGWLLYFSPFLSHLIHSINAIYTQGILKLIANPPKALSISFHSGELSDTLTLMLTFISIFASIILTSLTPQENNSLEPRYV